MAWTAANCTAVEEAIVNIIASGGAQTLELNGKRVTFYSLESLREMLAEMRREVHGDEQVTLADLRDMGVH